MKGNGRDFSYRMMADSQLMDVLKAIKGEYNTLDDHLSKEYFFSDKPIGSIMLDILQASDPVENGFSMQVLAERYRQYGTATFTLDDLFDEGWLINCGDEWSHNCRPDKYTEITFCETKREKDIVRFLSELADIRYMEQYALRVDAEGTAFLDTIDRYGITVDYLLDKGIISTLEDESGYYIDSSEEIWRRVGDIVLANYADRLFRGEGEDREQAYECWMDVCRRMPCVYHAARKIEDKEGLFTYCLKKIKVLSSTRKKEEKKILYGMRFAANSRNPLYEINIPSNARLRNGFYGRNVDLFYELKYLSAFGSTMCGKAMQICHDLFGMVSKQLMAKFLKVLTNPYFEIHRHYQGYVLIDEINVEAVHFDGLRYDSLKGIYGSLQRAASDRMTPIYDVNELASRLWDVIYHILPQQSEQDAVSDVLEFLIYLGQACHFGEELDKKRNRGPIRNNRTARVFFTYILGKLAEEYGCNSEINERIRVYLTERIDEESSDVEIKNYLQLLFAITTAMRAANKSESAWNDVARTEFLTVFRRAVNEGFGLTTISLRVIVDGLSANIRERAQFVSEILDIVQTGKKPSYRYEWIGTEGWGVILALYYMALDSEKWKNDAKSCKEFIKTLILYQSSADIFGIESMGLYNSEFVLKECMDVLSSLSAECKKVFLSEVQEEVIKEDTNFGISTLLTWAGFISNIKIRKALVELAAELGKGEIERISLSVDGIVKVFYETVKSVIWYRETVGSTDEVERGLTRIAERILADYEKWAKRVSGNREMKARAEQWIQDARSQLLYLSGNREELLSLDSDFYRGIALLESEDMRDINKASALFIKLFDRGSIAAGINAMAALVQLIRNGKENEEDISDLCLKFKSIRDKVASFFEGMTIEPDSGYFYSVLLYYGVVGENSVFRSEYERIPERYKYEPAIADVAVSSFLRFGDFEFANKIYEMCLRVYGECQKTEEIEEALKAYSRGETKGFGKSAAGIVTNDDILTAIDPRTIMQVLDRLKSMQGDELYQFFYSSGSVNEEILQKLGINVLNGRDERLLILDMLLSAATELTNYSPKLARIIVKKNVVQKKDFSMENTYNRTLALLIERRENRFLNYHAECEVSAGMPGHVSDQKASDLSDSIVIVEDSNEGENIVLNDDEKLKEIENGRIDVLISRGERKICIIEGIRIFKKINESDKVNIIRHIRKMIGYNTINASVAAMMVYYAGSDPSQAWTEYRNILKELERDGKGENKEKINMKSYVGQLKPKEVGVEINYSYLFASIHQASEFEEPLLVYHILVHIGETDV